jgi:hypothetical protein
MFISCELSFSCSLVEYLCYSSLNEYLIYVTTFIQVQNIRTHSYNTLCDAHQCIIPTYVLCVYICTCVVEIPSKSTCRL